MTDSSPSRRPLVLLLADAAREDWTRALEAGGIEVATTGWLDGITAARLRRPDLLLVATDLPEGAPSSILSAFRGAVDLYKLPIVVAGPGADELERWAQALLRADHYVPVPGGAEVFAGRIRDAIRGGRVPLLRKPAERAVTGLLLLALAAMTVRIGLQICGTRAACAISPAAEWLLLVVFAASAILAVGIGLSGRTRPFSIGETRTALGWLGVLLWNAGRMLPGDPTWGRFAGFTLGSCAFAAWALLGLKVKPRSRGQALAFRILAGALVLLGLAPWTLLR